MQHADILQNYVVCYIAKLPKTKDKPLISIIAPNMAVFRLGNLLVAAN